MGPTTQTMLAARVHEPGPDIQYRFEETPIRSIKPYELLLEVGAAGFCHTDTLVGLGQFSSGELPITGSHEPAGTVVEVGERAKEDGWVVGVRAVATANIEMCGVCTDCTSGEMQYCHSVKFFGVLGVNGAFAEYCIVDSRMAAKIPDGMSFERACPLSCAGVTVYRALKVANLRPGQIVAINGLGAVGMLGAQIAKAMGLKVVGIDARDSPISRLEGMKLAPDLTANALHKTAADLALEVRSLRDQGESGLIGPDAVIICTDAPQGLAYARDLVADHGTLVIIAGNVENMKFTWLDFLNRDLKIKGTLSGNGTDLKECVELCAKYGVESSLTVYRFEEEEMNRMVQDCKQPGWAGKAVVTIGSH